MDDFDSFLASCLTVNDEPRIYDDLPHINFLDISVSDMVGYYDQDNQPRSVEVFTKSFNHPYYLITDSNKTVHRIFYQTLYLLST